MPYKSGTTWMLNLMHRLIFAGTEAPRSGNSGSTPASGRAPARWRKVQSWWAVRERPNVLFVHFDDLTSDLTGQIRRVAGFLNIAVPDDAIGGIVDDLHDERLEEQMAQRDPAFARTFFRHRDRNGRWRGVLSAEDLELYERTASDVLSSDCRAWLEGRSSVD